MWTRDQDQYWEQQNLDTEQHDAYVRAGEEDKCPCPDLSHPKNLERFNRERGK